MFSTKVHTLIAAYLFFSKEQWGYNYKVVRKDSPCVTHIFTFTLEFVSKLPALCKLKLLPLILLHSCLLSVVAPIGRNIPQCKSSLSMSGFNLYWINYSWKTSTFSVRICFLGLNFYEGETFKSFFTDTTLSFRNITVFFFKLSHQENIVDFDNFQTPNPTYF